MEHANTIHSLFIQVELNSINIVYIESFFFFKICIKTQKSELQSLLQMQIRTN